MRMRLHWLESAAEQRRVSARLPVSAPTLLSYVLTMLAVIAATVVRYELSDLFRAQPFSTFFVAMLIISALLGLGPGLLATFLSTLCAIYFFMEPINSVKLPDHNDLVKTGIFLIIGVSFSVIAELTRRAKNIAAIAERRLSEVRLHGVELRLRLAVESAGIGVAEWNTATGEMNLDDRAHEHWGLPPGETIDYAGFLGAVRQEDSATMRTALNLALDPSGTGAFAAQFRVIGLLDKVERWISATGQTLFQEGRASRFVFASLDLTAKKSAELALKASEERFRSLTQALPGMVFECDAAGALVFISDHWTAYTDMSLTEALDQGWKNAVQPEDLAVTEQQWADCLRAGACCEVRHRLRAADGAYRWFMVRAAPRCDDAGRIVRWAGSCTDIEELVRAESALKEVNRQKDEFLAMLAHELRNPLAPIRNSVYILRNTDRDSAEAREREQTVLAMMERQISHLARLVDDLLDMSRINSGKISLQRQRTDIATILRDALDVSRPLIELEGHRLTVSIPPEPLPLDADPVRLAQLFANLLNNAAKFTERNGEIWLEAEGRGREVIVRVRDSGVGVSPDMLPRLFDLFTQGDGVKGRPHHGLGIGLTLVRSLALLHGGWVEARSEGQGRGTEFIVHLMLASSEKNEAEPDVGARTPVCPRRVLIIDDERDVADSLEMLLKQVGCNARAVYAGAAGLAALADFEPEIVFLDLGMPELDGYETARRIRALPAGRKLLLVALTGWGQESDRDRAQKAGFDHYLTKPASSEDLAGVLQHSA